jgi:hypothetical protein
VNQDEQHLKLLSIFHYIVGGIIALFSLFPIFHLVFGIVMIVSPDTFESGGEGPPAFIGWLFALIGGTIILVGFVLATCVILAGRFLSLRRHYTYCFVIACIQCLFIPFGTVLGVFTIIVLTRESVKQISSVDGIYT